MMVRCVGCRIWGKKANQFYCALTDRYFPASELTVEKNCIFFTPLVSVVSEP